MPPRKRPQKPLRNPSHLVFPRSGPIRFVEEQMPREQESLEATLGEKFRGSLEHFLELSLTPETQKCEPADLSYVDSQGARVDVQVVEVVDLILRAVSRMRSSYSTAVQSSLGATLHRFGGCRVTLVDSGDPPYLPLIGSAEGQRCLHQLVSYIASVAEGISTLQVGGLRSGQTTVGAVNRSIGLVVERLAPQIESAPLGGI